MPNLNERTTSSFPLSIGTALALESVFLEGPMPHYDNERKIPNVVKLNNYSEIWINLTTLIRNISGASDKTAFTIASPKEIMDILISEIDVINDLFAIEGKGVCIPRYYYCSYKQLKASYKEDKVKFRKEKTDLQLVYSDKVNKTLKLLFNSTDEYSLFDSQIKSDLYTNSLIITHIPYDLLSSSKFNKLDLLETHTGKLKTKHDWYSKYYPVGNIDLSNLPFLKILLLILGDHVLIQPNDIRLRRLITEVAEKGKWTTATTLEKVMHDFEIHVHEPFVVQYLKSL